MKERSLHQRETIGSVAYQRFVEVVFSELSGFVNDEVDSIAARREQVMLEGCWAIVGVHDVTRLLVDAADPVGELPRIWDGG